MPKLEIKKIVGRRDTKTASAKKQSSNVRKLKILITIVDRSKTLLYLDLLEQFEVNVQTVLYGRGTANSQMLDILGLVESDKSAIISWIREDKVKEALEAIGEKFSKVKNGKGVAYTIPMDSIIGVSSYQILSNDRTQKDGGKNNEKRI